MNASAGADDAALLRAAGQGDEHALRLLFERHSPWLHARLRHRCADPDAVADVLQDTFVAAWKGARKWREEGEVAAWLWGIAVRRLVSRLRQRSPARQTELLPAELLPAEERLLASAEEQVLIGVEHGDAGAALRRLSPELRAVVQATVLDGLTTSEAAKLLNLPLGTVKSRLRKAKAELRAGLIGYVS